jgi:hypothetical protein
MVASRTAESGRMRSSDATPTVLQLDLWIVVDPIARHEKVGTTKAIALRFAESGRS